MYSFLDQNLKISFWFF